jgi:two-component system, sensor histidine kinase RegB
LERFASTLPDGEAALADAKLIRTEVDRCRLILEKMSIEGAEPMGETARSIQVTELFNEVLRQFPEEQRRHLAVEVADLQAVAVLPVEATIQSLAALVKNALDANLRGVPVRLTAMRSGSEITFAVTDQGQGMSETMLRRIGEPFFTTKEPGRGMGLGTFLASTFAARMGGRLSYSSSPGKGTTALLELPSNWPKREAHNAV